MKIIVRTLKGLEPVLAKELESIGCTEIQPLTRAVMCESNVEQMYKANLMLRTALKVMVPLGEYIIKNEMQLYEAVKSIAWEDIFKVTQTFAVEGVVFSDTFRHSQYAALKAKDAIADRFRDINDKRPFVNPSNADVRVIIHIRQNILTILLDASGHSLHMRGYRMYPVDAPINEVLAAGLIMLAEWDGKTTLIDPMCGSGTFLIEAAKIATNTPPQSLERKYCFMSWADYNPTLWNNIIEEAKSNIVVNTKNNILGFDKSLRCISATATNAEEAGVASQIKLERKDFFQSQAFNDVFLITNPPYDERLKEEDIILFYKNIGNKLKQDYTNCQAWIISGHIEAIKNLGLKPSKKFAMLNGDIESAFYKYEIYEGSKKFHS